MSIFKVNKRSFGQLQRKLSDDIAEDLRTEMQEILMSEKSYYDRVALSFEIEKTPEGAVIGSEEMGAAALDVGADWKWSKMPNLDNIKEWVRKHKDDGKYASAPEREVHDIAVKVALKIKDEGVDSLYYVDEAIRFFSDNEVDME